MVNNIPLFFKVLYIPGGAGFLPSTCIATALGLCHGKTGNPWQPEGGAYYGFHGTWFQCVQWCQQLPYLAGFEDGTTTKT